MTVQSWNEAFGSWQTIYPTWKVLSVVPVGLTKFRDGLYPLKPFTKEDAKEVLEMIHKWQKICYEKHGTHFVQASDEWYLLAEEPFPPEENYDGYIQLENGVGMIPLLASEFDACLELEQEEGEKDLFQIRNAAEQEPKVFELDLAEKNKTGGCMRERSGYRRIVSIATGKSAAPLMRKLAA